MTLSKPESYTLLILSVLVIYSGTLHHSFHFDDTITVMYPTRIRDIDNFFSSLMELSIRPILLLTFKVNYAIHKFDVVGYHIVNISIHCVNVLLVYILLNRIGCDRNSALIGALLFAVHPIQTQSVTYISCRSVLLATTFYLVAVLAFLSKRYVTVGICFVLGMLTKEILISLPITAIVIHWLVVSRETLFSYISKYNKIIGLILFSMTAIALYRIIYSGGILPSSQTPYSVAEYFMTQLVAIPAFYVQKILMPVGLSIDHEFPIYKEVPSYLLIFYGLVVFSIWNSSRLMLLGILWFFITIAPESSFVPLLDVVTEHRLYLPMVGASIIVTVIVNKYGLWFKRICYGMLFVLAVMSIDRNRVWATEVSLWTDARDKYPMLVRPHNNLGDAYDKLGEYWLATIEYENCLKLEPNYELAIVNLGNIYGKAGNLDMAQKYFEKALAINDRIAEAHYNLATIYLKRGMYGDALYTYEKALAINPDMHDARLNAGISAHFSGDIYKKRLYLDEYVRINGSNDQLKSIME